MEGRRNWQGWAALALAALALIITLTGRQGPSVSVQVPGYAASAPSQAQNAPQAGSGFGAPQQNAQDNQRSPRDGFGPQAGYNGGFRHHGPGPFFFAPFFFLGGILRFVFFALIIGFLFRFFTGRRGWGRGWGGPPWARGGPHGPCHQGQRGPEGTQPEQPQTQPTSQRDEPTTGETTRL